MPFWVESGVGMKYKSQITGLQVLSIVEVNSLGKVEDLLINPESGMVDFLVIEPEKKFLEHRLVAFKDVAGFGQDALTVETSAKVTNFSSDNHALALLDKAVDVLGAKVMTRSGRFHGSVDEIVIDEHSGKISACRWNEGYQTGFIPNNSVITFGKNLLIVDDDFEATLTDDPLQTGQIIMQPSNEFSTEVLNLTPKVIIKEPKHRQYLVGRTVLTDILAEDGSIVAHEGEVVNQDIVDLAVKLDRYADLTLNTRE